MKTFPLLLLFLLTIIPPCWSQVKKNTATITINSATQPNADVKIFSYQYLENNTIAESRTDSAGHASLTLTIAKPVFVTITIGKKYGEIYLAPGFNLNIKETAQDYAIPLTFQGKGAEANNYINWISTTTEKIKWANNRGLIELDKREFDHRFDSLKTAIKNFHKAYLDSVKIPKEIVPFLEYKNNVITAGVEQEYHFYKFNEAIAQKWEAYKNGQYVPPADSTITVVPFKNGEIPGDTTFLLGDYLHHDIMLIYYWFNRIKLPVADKHIGATDYEEQALLNYKLIKEINFPPALCENLSAMTLQRYLWDVGITPQTEAIFSDFKQTYKHSSYLPALNKIYNGFLALTPGNQAPSFEGYTPDGKKVSTNDLAGKIIYIDVWSTGCKPCIEEIPASIKLQQQLANEAGIQFVNITTDSDEATWKKFLEKHADWKGIHLFMPEEERNAFLTTYKLSGIPDYILIDQSGNIVNVKAPHPSQAEAITEIKKLLEKSGK